MMTTIPDLLDASARLHGDRRAVITPEQVLSYVELRRLATRFGQNLCARGVSPGDRVVLWLGNSWRWIVAYYGVLFAGAELVPANGQLAPHELAHILGHCRPKVLIASSADHSRLSQAVGEIITVSVGAHPGALDFDALLEPTGGSTQESARRRSSADTAQICYTSGTTGVPKGVVLSHASLVTSARDMALLQGKSSSDVIGTALPCCHVYGTMVLNSAIASGAALVLRPSLDVMGLFADIDRHRITVLEGVPTTYYTLLQTRHLKRFNLGGLRLCSVGGQAISEPRLEEVEKRLKCPLHELWGMTELAGPGTTHPHNVRRVAGSIGTPLPYLETRVANPEDPSRTLPTNAIGELLVRGPLVMKGYLDDAQATQTAITPDGWLRTGDLVRRDGRGYLYLVDRLKDVILSGGYTLYPAEIERVLCSYPAVAQAGVISIDDDIRGQVAKAVVTLRPGVYCQPEDLIAHCREHLAKFKVPRKLEIVETMPTGPTGKLLRRQLREQEPAPLSAVCDRAKGAPK